MDLFSRNLRFFFGADSTMVWSLWRDRERALRSIEIYKMIKKQLKADLKLEKGKRGTLVRVRSNEVTEVKDKMRIKSDERLTVNKALKENEGKVDTFLGRLDVNVKALLTSSPYAGEIQEDVEKNQTHVEKLDKEFAKISEELAEAVYKQNAAEDPIDDLEFAIDHLNSEIDLCKERSVDICVRINQLIVQQCLEGSPLQLELMLQNGLQPEDTETFCGLYLDIHDSGSELVAQPQAPVDMAECDFAKTVNSGIKVRKIPLNANVSMSGTGYHHRKVRRGKNRVWREFDVSFSGKVNARFNFPQMHWNSSAGVAAIQKTAQYHFHEARNTELKKLEKDYETLKHTLLNQAGRLFELM